MTSLKHSLRKCRSNNMIVSWYANWKFKFLVYELRNTSNAEYRYKLIREAQKLIACSCEKLKNKQRLGRGF